MASSGQAVPYRRLAGTGMRCVCQAGLRVWAFLKGPSNSINIHIIYFWGPKYLPYISALAPFGFREGFGSTVRRPVSVFSRFEIQHL